MSDADTGLVTSAAREILHELNPEIPPRFRTFSQIYSASLGSRRFNVILVGCFAMLALVLAAVGIFGVMAYSVSRRTREIGVRMALGAHSPRRCHDDPGPGVAHHPDRYRYRVSRFPRYYTHMQSLLFGVTATDPVTFAAVIVLLATTALLACYIPARRAAKVDPMVALRYE